MQEHEAQFEWQTLSYDRRKVSLPLVILCFIGESFGLLEVLSLQVREQYCSESKENLIQEKLLIFFNGMNSVGK